MRVKRKKNIEIKPEDIAEIQHSTREGSANRWMCNLSMPSRNIITATFKMYEQALGEQRNSQPTLAMKIELNHIFMLDPLT